MDPVVLGGFGRHYIAPALAKTQPPLCACPSLYGCTQPCDVLQRKTKGLHHRSATEIMQLPPTTHPNASDLLMKKQGTPARTCVISQVFK